MTACGFPDLAEGALAFTQRVLDASEGRLAVVKPQSAYFERFGSAGWQALEETIAYARKLGVLVLLDAKRGDIDTTAKAYAEAFFSPTSRSRVDAVTVHPYLGFDALRLFLEYSVAQGGGVFVVVRSSNPEGEALQKARLENGRSVAEDLAHAITTFNRATFPESMGGVGAVVGATCPDADTMVGLMPTSYVLAPGIGAQGATILDLPALMPRARERVLPSVSRGIVARGGSKTDLASMINNLRDQAQRMWQ